CDATNLALRAATTLREAAKIDRGVHITLDKRIPVAAGLGGGSSDAAAVLLGLNRLWGLRWPAARLAEVATALGMDVPFFLRSGAALGTGRGEVLEPVVAGALALVLVNPAFGSSTAEAYGRVTAAMYTDGSRARKLAELLRTRQAARVATRQSAGLWIPYSEVRILPPQPRSGEAGDEIRPEAFLGQREPSTGGRDRPISFPAGERRRNLPFLRRRGLRAGERERPGDRRLRGPADLTPGEGQPHGASVDDRRAQARVGASDDR